MRNIESVFSIRNKQNRYNKLCEWIFNEIFQCKGSILELHEFSEGRKVRKNGKKLLAELIFSKDPESSAFIGPSVTFRIFEIRKKKAWRIDIIGKPFRGFPAKYKDIDFKNFINPSRAEALREFIWK